MENSLWGSLLVAVVGSLATLIFKSMYDKREEVKKDILLAEAMKDLLENVFILNLKEIEKDYKSIIEFAEKAETFRAGKTVSSYSKIDGHIFHSLNYIDVPFLLYFDKLDYMKIIKLSLKIRYSELVKAQKYLEKVIESNPMEFRKIYNSIKSPYDLEVFAFNIGSRCKELSEIISIYNCFVEEIDKYIEKLKGSMC